MSDVTSDCRQAKRRLLRTREAAEYLGLSAWSVRQLVQNGRLPVVRGCDDCNLQFDVCDLDAYVAQHRQIFAE